MLRRLFLQLVTTVPPALSLTPKIPLSEEDIDKLDEVLPPLPPPTAPPRYAARQLVISPSLTPLRYVGPYPQITPLTPGSRMFSQDWVFEKGVFVNRSPLVPVNPYMHQAVGRANRSCRYLIVSDLNAPWVCCQVERKDCVYGAPVASGADPATAPFFQVRIQPEDMPTLPKAAQEMPPALAADRRRNCTAAARDERMARLRRVFGDAAVNAWLDTAKG